jgi:beta-glucosidase
VVNDAPVDPRGVVPGIQAGNAVADVVFGDVNPGGKLPVSFPRSVGQVPIYYNHENTGRPCDATSKYNSRYRDINSCDPQYVFGYGLSYSKFEITNLRLSSSRVSRNGSVRATVDVKNVSGPKGDEVVQLYIHDPGGEPRPAGAEAARLRARDARTRQTKSVTFTARQERLELLRQPREAGQRARSDRRLRGRQLEGGDDQVVPGHGLTATATSRVSTPNGDPSRSP